MRLLILLLLSFPVFADPYEGLRDYPDPIICKPIVERDGITVVGEEKTWVTLPWKDLLGISDKLLFKHLDGVFTVPHKGYICQH